MVDVLDVNKDVVPRLDDAVWDTNVIIDVAIVEVFVDIEVMSELKKVFIKRTVKPIY